jgi:iron complex outermembrane receptor protein
MSNFKQLPNAIRFALFAGTASALVTAPAFAQDTAQAQDVEGVEVIGSRIRRAVQTETAQPVQVISRAQIEATGMNNVFDVLNNITASDGSGLSTVTTQTNGSNGAQTISLRGIGSQRTLVLVDGKRWANDGAGSTDLSTIPVAIIERIDVLKDGASAIYGSDAIAGVINIVTRRNFEGAQASASFGQTAEGDGQQSSADLTIGARGERTQATFSISTSTQDEIFAGDRERSQFPVFGAFGETFWAYYGYSLAATCENYLSGAYTYDPFGLAAVCGSASGEYGRFVVSGSMLVPNGTYALNHVTLNPQTGTDPFVDSALTATDYHIFRAADRYNFAPVNYLQQPAERNNLYGAARFDLTDNISVYGRISYTKRTSTQQLAEVPLTIANAGNNGPQWTMNISALSIFNPFGVQINTANYRMSALGPRTNHFDVDAYNVQLGAEGNFQLGERYMNWELYAQYNDSQYDERSENYINTNNLRNSLGQSGFDPNPGRGFFCGATWATRIVGCVPFNIFGGPTVGLGAVYAGHAITAADVAAMMDYIGYTLVQTNGNTTTNFGGNLSGDLFELPGGMAAFAVGFEYRKDDTFNQPDALITEGSSSTNFALATYGATDVTEYYAEIALPLLKDAALAQELELNIAVRRSDYHAAGIADPDPIDATIETANFDFDQGSPTNWRASIKWKPIEDLLVRASWGETFRAPNAFDLFGGIAEGFPQANDPCRVAAWGGLNANEQANCIAAGVPVGGSTQIFAQQRAFFGSNVDLVPESGENWSIGLVYSPSWAEGLNIAVDMWNVYLEDAISSFGAGAIMNRCYTNNNPDGTDGVPFFCQFVVRDLTPGAGAPIAVINSVALNVASFETQGIDIGIGYAFETDWGKFRIDWDTTWTDFLETTTVLDPSDPASPILNNGDAVGSYNGSPNWEWRSNVRIGWTKGDWSLDWTTRFMSDIAENCFTSCNDRDNDFLNHSGNYAVHDLQVRWNAPWDATIAVGGRNIFGKEPPVFTNNTFAHSFDAAYDLPGGAYWYAQYRQDF